MLQAALAGTTTFEAFIDLLGMARNVLSSRLKVLLAAGVLERQPYGPRPSRYQYLVTPRGHDFVPVLDQAIAWSERHFPELQIGAPAVPPGAPGTGQDPDRWRTTS